MSGDVRLRRIADEADAKRLVRWRNENAACFPPQADWTVESHLRWFRDVYSRDPCDNMFIVELDGRPVGCLAMTIRNGRGELGRVILGDKSIARSGVMSRALRQLIDAYGLGSYWLRVYPQNVWAVAFYERNGFAACGTDGDWLIMTGGRHAPAVGLHDDRAAV